MGKWAVNSCKKLSIILVVCMAAQALAGCGSNSFSVNSLLDKYAQYYYEAAAEQTGTIEASGDSAPWSVKNAQQDADEDTEESDGEDTDSFSFLMDEAGHYAYDGLSDAQKIWYKDIERTLGSMKKDVKLSWNGILSGLDEKDLDEVFQCVMIDHPEIFYVDGYSYDKYFLSDKTVSIRFSGTYNCDYDTAAKKAMEIETAADKILADAPHKGSGTSVTDYDIVKYVYDTLILGTDYNLESEDNQNIYSVFVNKESVCLGYAKATQYLLLKLGIECTLVHGTVEGNESHAWNLVKADGDYYYVDTTWGDASYRNDEADTDYNYSNSINYDYLCVTTEQLLRTHTIDSYLTLPVCTAMTDNYYVKEDALFYGYDEEKIRQLFDRAVSEGKNSVTIKCSDNECFNEIKTQLIDNQKIFNCISEETTQVTYANNSRQLSLTFWISVE